MTISFNQIGAKKVPFVYAEIDNSKANQGPLLQSYRGLMIGQKLSGGTATANVPVRVTSAAQVKLLAGAGSMLWEMSKAWFENNDATEVWMIPLADNGAGVQATGTLAFSGTATAAGTIYLYIGNYRLTVGVSAGDTASVIGTAVAAAINADTDLPVTASGTSTVTLTYRHKGTVGNEVDLRTNYFEGEIYPAGVSVVVTAFASGATNPSLTAAIAAMAEVEYHAIAFPYNDATSLSAIEAALDDRWGPDKQIDGLAFSAKYDTLANLLTFGDSRNSEFVSVMDAYKFASAHEVSAAIAAMVAFFAPIDPARPMQTLSIQGVRGPKLSEKRLKSEQEQLLSDGIATSFVDPSGNPAIQRLITTYQENSQSAPDPSYLDVTTLTTLSYIRFDLRNYFLLKYPRHKLANDGTRFGEGQAIMTPMLAKAELYNKFRDWELLGLVENFDQFKADLIVERNISDPNRLDMYVPPDLVNGLVVVAVQIGFRL